MAGTPMRVLNGRDALDTLVFTYKLPDWQAKKVLATARLYGLDNIPVDGGYSTMSVEYKGGHFHVGGYLRGSRFRHYTGEAVSA
jgi:hypothetical protein